MKYAVKLKPIIRLSTFIVAFFLSTCGTTAGDSIREESILKHATEDKRQKYADLLVNPAQYTTKGGDYQKTYHRHLIGVAGEITEKRGLVIVPGTVGFYYDKKSNDKSRLYFGLDVLSSKSYPVNLTTEALRQLRRDVSIIIRTLNSCKSVLNEKEVVGMVIGWKWHRDAGDDFISLWIDKNDVNKYEQKELTLEEVIQRGVITNSVGKVIRLP